MYHIDKMEPISKHKEKEFTIFTEKLRCNKCLDTFKYVKLKDDTPVCCPNCKYWTLFKDLKIKKGEI